MIETLSHGHFRAVVHTMSSFDRYQVVASPERMLALALLCLLMLGCAAQVINEDALRKLPLPERPGAIACLEPLPDGHTIAAAYSKGGGIVLVDTSTWSVVRSIPIDGFHDGARLTASNDGRYLLLKEVGRFTNEGRRDIKGEQAVLDLTSGNVALREKAMDSAISGDGGTFATLDGEEVIVRHVPDGSTVRTIRVSGATNAIAISPDGSLLAVGHTPTEALLGNIPSVRADKKGMKTAMKFRQMVSLYHLSDGMLWRTANEVYDIIRSMAFTPDGTQLLVYSSADPRLQRPSGSFNDFDFSLVDRPGRVEQIDARTAEPLRASFMSRMNEPFLAVAPELHLIALSSTEGRNKRKLLVFDTLTGDTRAMIDLAQKHRYDVSEGEEHDGREPYCWLQNGCLLLALGDHLALWQP